MIKKIDKNNEIIMIFNFYKLYCDLYIISYNIYVQWKKNMNIIKITIQINYYLRKLDTNILADMVCAIVGALYSIYL